MSAKWRAASLVTPLSRFVDPARRSEHALGRAADADVGFANSGFAIAGSGACTAGAQLGSAGALAVYVLATLAVAVAVRIAGGAFAAGRVTRAEHWRLRAIILADATAGDALVVVGAASALGYERDDAEAARLAVFEVFVFGARGSLRLLEALSCRFWIVTEATSILGIHDLRDREGGEHAEDVGAFALARTAAEEKVAGALLRGAAVVRLLAVDGPELGWQLFERDGLSGALRSASAGTSTATDEEEREAERATRSHVKRCFS